MLKISPMLCLLILSFLLTTHVYAQSVYVYGLAYLSAKKDTPGCSYEPTIKIKSTFGDAHLFAREFNQLQMEIIHDSKRYSDLSSNCPESTESVFETLYLFQKSYSEHNLNVDLCTFNISYDANTISIESYKDHCPFILDFNKTSGNFFLTVDTEKNFPVTIEDEQSTNINPEEINQIEGFNFDYQQTEEDLENRKLLEFIKEKKPRLYKRMKKKQSKRSKKN